MRRIGKDGRAVGQYTADDFNQREPKIDEKCRLDVFNGACMVRVTASAAVIMVLMHRCLHG